MLTALQIEKIMLYSDVVAHAEVMRGFHHALNHEEEVKRYEKKASLARESLENLLNMMKISDK